MKVVIPGGSGQVGSILARHFHALGDEVVVLSRAAQPAPWKVRTWNGRTLDKWVSEIDGCDVVINLAGRSVNCRYTLENRKEILISRVDSTQAVGRSIAEAAHPPRVWLQASTATIYSHRYDTANDENTGIVGGTEPDAPDTWQFSIDVATAWERAHNQAVTPRTRKVLLRSAMTMSPDRGGVFDSLLRLVRLGLGGRAGDGRQFVSWIHHRDFNRAVEWIIDHEQFAGPVNLAAPTPLPYAEFQRDLRKAWGIPFGLPATSWMVEIGTRLLGTESELVLKSRRVIPARLLQSGFAFDFPAWPEAARDLCVRWRERRRGAARNNAV
jgi:uncharacterized protein (TIGR01777 family)